MSTPLIIKYPYDPSGRAFTNAVQDELHLLPRNRNRAFALNAGPFYADSVEVRTVPGNQLLVAGTHYRALYLYDYFTRKTGQSVCAVIHVFDEAIQGTVSVNYQVVGGEASSNATAIQQLIQSLEIDNRGIVFDDLIDLPVTWPPSPHLHHVGDWYGMEQVVDVLRDIWTAMDNQSSEVDVLLLRQRVDALQNAVDSLNQRVTPLQSTQIQHNDRIATLEQISTQLQQNDAAQQSAINTLQNTIAQVLLRLTAIEQSQTQLQESLDSSNRFIIVTTDIQLEVGKQYYFTVATEGTLPEMSGVPIGSAIKVSHRHEQFPIYRVSNSTTDTIVYKNQADVIITHDVKETAIIVKTSQNEWSVFV